MSASYLTSLGLHIRPRVPARHYLIVVLLAFAGGFFGILGAMVSEVQTGGFLLLPFLGAPVIEEAMKPSGVYLGLLRWPEALSNRLFTACLAAIGGFIFGIVEALVYTEIYVSDPSDRFVIYRFTVPIIMHTGASFIYGLGISRGIIDWAAGRGSIPKRTRYLYVAAVAIHAIFNMMVATLEWTDTVEFQ